MPYLMRTLAAAAALCALPLAAAAQTSPWPGYAPKLFRWDEDYSALKDRPPAQWPLRLKYLPLDTTDFLSLGGEYRFRIDDYSHPDFGLRNAPDFTSREQRLLLNADAQLGADARVFLQVGEAFESGRPAPLRPGDRGHLDLTEGFVDLRWGPAAARWRLRLGRQEVAIGRFVAIRDGTSLRRTFDGARLDGPIAGWNVTALAARPTRQRLAAFDDDPDPSDSLLAVAADHASPIDGYRLGLAALQRDNGQARYSAGVGRERRTTVGARLFGARGPWDADGQVSYQFGRFTPFGRPIEDIGAWGAAFEGGRKVAAPWSPRLAVRLDAAGGDGRGGDRRLATFDLPYPNLSYLTDAAIFAPRNVRDVQPFLVLSPNAKLTLTLGGQFVWRMSKADSVYSPAGFPVVGPGGRGSRVATSPYVRVSWRINPLLEWQAAYVHSEPGEALKSLHASRAQDFATTSLSARF